MTTHIEMIKNVLTLQDKFNQVVNPNWKNAGYPFYRAAWLEMAEFVEGVGTWKWWKKADRGNREQCVLELVDIFHFVLSDAILNNRDAYVVEGAYNRAFARKNKNPKNADTYLFDEVEAFIEIMLTDIRQSRGIPLVSFFDVVVAFDVTLEELLTKYIGKNVLNNFRQDNGYKSGAYVKSWDAAGSEDNVYLVKFRDELGTDLTFDTLYDKLRTKYQEVLMNLEKA